MNTTKIGVQMFCNNCGKEMKDESIFCWNCGNKVVVKKELMTEDMQKDMRCKYCDKEINIKADICPHCGVRLRTIVAKNPGVASVLSFFVPGLGQIYNGDIIIGVAFVIIEVLSLSVGIVLLQSKQTNEALILIVVCIIFWIYSMYNARKTAEKINAKIE